MSTTIQSPHTITAPEPDAPANYFAGAAFAYGLDAVIVSAVRNQGAPVEGCRVTLQLSADGGRTYSDARTVAAGISDGATTLQAFALADFAALASWTHWRLRWGGNIGAAVVVSAIGDSGSLSGGGGATAVRTDQANTYTAGPQYLGVGALETTLFDNGNSGAAATISWDNGNNQSIAITGAATLSFVAPSHPGKFTLVITQDATGHAYTLPTIKWPGGVAPTLSSSANAIDVITVLWTGSYYLGQAATNFS